MAKLTALRLLIGGAVLLIAACGSSTSDTSSVTTSSSSSSSSSSSASSSPSSSSSSAPAATPAVAATVSTGTATVSGKSETVLTDAATGKTLYYRTTDTSTSVTCTGSCAGAWPPLMPPASGQPTSSAPLPGPLTVLNGADGKQVLYKGHPLYGFKSDNAPGQATGQGVASFVVVTPDVAAVM